MLIIFSNVCKCQHAAGFLCNHEKDYKNYIRDYISEKPGGNSFENLAHTIIKCDMLPNYILPMHSVWIS